MTTPAQLAAYFYKSKVLDIYELHSLDNGHREILKVMRLKGKAAARAQAAADNAKPWNF